MKNFACFDFKNLQMWWVKKKTWPIFEVFFFSNRQKLCKFTKHIHFPSDELILEYSPCESLEFLTFFLNQKNSFFIIRLFCNLTLKWIKRCLKKNPRVANYLPFQLMIVFLTQRSSLSFANGGGLDEKSWSKRRICFEIEILRRRVHLARANQR